MIANYKKGIKKHSMDSMSQTTIYYSRINIIKTVQDYDSKNEKFLSRLFSELIRKDIYPRTQGAEF